MRRRKVQRVSEIDQMMVTKVKGSRAIYQGSSACEEIEVTLTFESGQVATIRLTPDAAGKLATDISVAYNAIRPQLNGSWPAQWKGM